MVGTVERGAFIKTAEENFNHAARQAILAFSIAKCRKRMTKVDASMGGFNGSALDDFWA